MNIKGRLVTLRAPEPSDLALLNKWANDPNIWENLGGWHFPYSMASTKAWLESRRSEDPNNQVYCIEVADRGVIGTASLNKIDWKNRSAFHGLMLGEEEFRGQGYAMDTEFAIMRYAFEELDLHRLDAEVVGSNERSLRMTAKCGWRVEGKRREWYFRRGASCDMVLLGILRSEYEERVHALRYWEQEAA